MYFAYYSILFMGGGAFFGHGHDVQCDTQCAAKK